MGGPLFAPLSEGEPLQAFLISQLPYAYWWCFALLLLGGFNLPISEELVVLCAGFLAYKVGLVSYTAKMLLAVWLGAICGDHVAFGMGRLLGKPLLNTRLFLYLYPPARRVKVDRWFEQYGAWTLFFGRFLPFGIRNGVILTASVSHTSYAQFAFADALACTLIAPLLFGLGYTFADNFQQLAQDIRMVYFGLFTILFAITFFLLVRRRYTKHGADAPSEIS